MKEDRNRVRIDLSLEIKKKLKVLSAMADTTISALVSDLVEQEYRRMNFPPVPPAPVEINLDDLP